MTKALRNKKGSAMITTILVMLLVCVLVTIMLTLSLYSQSMSKIHEKEITRQNRLDMLTDMFLKYNQVPADTFNYKVQVFYFEDGSSVMTVRQKESSQLCDMIVEQQNGELIARYYDAPYEHTESTTCRTIGIHNVQDNNPHVYLRLSKSAVSANGPFYVYAKIKLERAVSLNGGTPRAYVNLSMNGGAQTTVMTLNGNTNGWVNLHKADGSALKFDSVPSTSLDFLFGLDKTSGDLTIADLVIVNTKGVVCYSLANDPYLNGIGDLRVTNKSSWRRGQFTHYSTQAPIVTQDPDNYVPNKVLSLSQQGYRCHGEPFLALYKSALRDLNGAGYYYITGRFRTSITGRAEVCDTAGDSPTGMFLDVHGWYDHDNNDSTPDFRSTYPAGVDTTEGAYFASSGQWAPLLDQNGQYLKFYVPADCERTGEDYIKFTLWAAMGYFELADIRVYWLPSKNATPNPGIGSGYDKLVYDMERDLKIGNKEIAGCNLGGEQIIDSFWSAHWLSYQKNASYADKLDYTQHPGSFSISSIVNPINVSHNANKDYDLIQFPNKPGDTYNPDK